MRSRIIVVPDDSGLLRRLATRLRAEGHEVTAIVNPEYVVPPPLASDCWKSRSPGRPMILIRMRVTGLPRGEPYAGVLGSFLAEPASIAALMKSLAVFGT
jgi:hypothetical protein